ncbi:hypothetical protein JQC92_03870 [Shewanella sp. 202IG2-18]|uniref:protein-tyrosine phosphatase family protein n=1 Tax=Parashewanella hymeniacidonis TaxID=2807618 RepID=UPI001961AC23|nr:protein-tyrosine phosphatase family protein [Parashewanella hymeniacidonis]MBM7071179.1 hypothetical protein [Parashewanella hymeniacidonis]
MAHCSPSNGENITPAPVFKYCDDNGDITSEEQSNWLYVSPKMYQACSVDFTGPTASRLTRTYRRVVSFLKGTETGLNAEQESHQQRALHPASANNNPQKEYQVRQLSHEREVRDEQSTQTYPEQPIPQLESRPTFILKQPSDFKLTESELANSSSRYTNIRVSAEYLKKNPLMTIQNTKFSGESFYRGNAVRMNNEIGESWVEEPTIGLYHGNTIHVAEFNLAIACQYPLVRIPVLTSKPDNIERFLQMLMEYNIEIVVNLTSKKDNEIEYFRNNEQHCHNVTPFDFRLFMTEKLSESEGVSKMLITSTNWNKVYLSKKVVDYLHFQHWKDFGDAELCDFVRLIDKVRCYSRVVVHCRAGKGRTMTLFAGVQLRAEILKGKVSEVNLEQSIDSIILNMREQRQTGAINHAVQRTMLVSIGRYYLYLRGIGQLNP